MFTARRISTFILFATSCIGVSQADTVLFTKGDEAFEIEFVTIDVPGNPPDEPDNQGNAWGAVGYRYQISKYEVTNTAYGVVFSNSVSPEQAVLPAGGGWSEMAAIVNFMNTQQGFHPAYNIVGPINDLNERPWDEDDEGYDPSNPYRNSLARYVMPSADEWHKAAYFDPTTGQYFDYANGSNTLPMGVSVPTVNQDEAVYGGGDTVAVDVTQAGGLSPFGTMGQTGNGPEYEENFYSDGFHAVRSGAQHDPSNLRADQSRLFPLLGGGLRVVRLLPQSGVVGDFDDDGILTAADVDLLSLQLRIGSGDLLFDLNSDDTLDDADRTVWVEQLALTAFGDADLNGSVDFADFLALSAGFDQLSGWSGGDFDGDGVTEFSDFLILSKNYGTGTDFVSVPEPVSAFQFYTVLSVLFVVVRRSAR